MVRDRRSTRRRIDYVGPGGAGLPGGRPLGAQFVDARKRMDGDFDDLAAYRDFSEIRQAVKTILMTVGDREARVQA